jgi:transcriptional regulator GlxA family with amidase domain
VLQPLTRLLRSETKALDVSNARALIDRSAVTAAGLSVTLETCLHCLTVRGAVAVLAESLGQLPLPLYRRGDDSSKAACIDRLPVAMVQPDRQPVRDQTG